MGNKKILVVICVVFYALVSGIGNHQAYVFVTNHLDGNYLFYVLGMLFIQIILALIAIISMKKLCGGFGNSFGKWNKGSLKWFIPHYVILITTIILTIPNLLLLNERLIKVSVVFLFITLFIGIAEEVLFRGVVLKCFSENSIRKGMFASALLFSLFHFSNLLILPNLLPVIGQVVSTFVFGMFTAAIAVKSNTLLPLILYHWLWDLMEDLSSITQVNVNIANVNILLNLVMAIILWKVCFKKNEITEDEMSNE